MPIATIFKKFPQEEKIKPFGINNKFAYGCGPNLFGFLVIV